MSKEALESVESSHSALGISHGMVESREALESSILRLEAFERAEDALREATAGSGIGEKAESLRELATDLGSAQAEVARLKGVVEQCRMNISNIEEWIAKLKQNDDPGSLLNRRLSRISQLRELCSLVTDSVRREFASPLEEAFAEGFELLQEVGSLEAKTTPPTTR